MGLGRALPVGHTVANDRFGDDQRWTAGLSLSRCDRLLHGLHVVAVGPHHMPAVRLEALGVVVAVRQIGGTVNGDVVVVVQVDQLAQPQVPRQRRRFVRHAFLQVAVRADRVGVVVDDGKAGPVELSREVALGDGHTYAGGKALA